MRLPKTVIRRLNLHAGNFVEVREAVHGQTISIIPIRQRAISLAEMIALITKKNLHDATDWGRAVGKEVW